MIPKISVVVTTYNRADLLKGCLESLCQQTLDHSLYEIIVVDNHSTDDTHEVVEFFQRTGIVHYLMESQQGMNHARNLGLKEAHGNFVAYIDDDALAASEWLEVAEHAFATVVPTPDCLGGPIFPFYTSPMPEWFKDKYEIRRDWDTPRYLKAGQSFSGSNMIWRKEVLEDLGGFNPETGVIGNTLRLGGETIVFSKMWSTHDNPNLYFSPDLIVRHWVPDFKMKVSYRLRRNLAVGLFWAGENRQKLSKLKRIVLTTIDILKITLRALVRFPRYRHWQNWVIEECSSGFLTLGELLGLLEFHPSLRNN